jgi:hypothetical protein
LFRFSILLLSYLTEKSRKLSISFMDVGERLACYLYCHYAGPDCPRRDGEERKAIELLLEIDLKVKAVVSSGYSEASVLAHF